MDPDERPEAVSDPPRIRRSARTGAALLAAALAVAVGTVTGTPGGVWQTGPADDATGQVTTQAGRVPPVGHSDPAGNPPLSEKRSDRARQAELAALLDRRAAAVLTGDRAALLADVDPAAQATQAQLLDRVAEVPLARWTYRVLIAPAVDPADPTRWLAEAELTYRLGEDDVDWDTADVQRRRALVLRPDGTSWQLVSDSPSASGDDPAAAGAVGGGPATAAADLWDLGPVTVVRGEASLILGTASEPALTALATEADAAVRAVDQAWTGRWPGRVVVLAPADTAQLAAVLARDEAGLDQVGAVTTGEVGQADGRSADRVVVNTAAMARLGDLGRGVVMTHETTHVATRVGGGARVPMWLSEGFADHVAYRDTGVERAVIAADVLDLVARGQEPDALPGSDDFDPRRGNIAPAYAAAWLACDLVERRVGPDGPRRVMAATAALVAAGTDPDEAVDTALQDVVGTDTAGFTRWWVEHLDQVASAR